MDSLDPAAASQYLVSEDQARAVAENIALSPGVLAQRWHNVQTGDTQRVFQGSQRLLNLTAVPAADGQPGLYLCNYTQGGFSIVAADRHMQPILAFAEHGSLPTADLHNPQLVPDGLITWLENTKLIAAALRQYPGANNEVAGARAAWKQLTATSSSSELLANSAILEAVGTPADEPIANKVPWNAGPPPPSYAQYGPFVQAAWGQETPYNAQCLFDGVLCKTGCVATAMAQIMSYWQYPATYQWSAMPYVVGPTGYPELARLMHNAGDAVGMSYGASESSANSHNIPDGFKSFGYSSAEFHDYPSSSSKSNIANTFYSSSSYLDVMDNLSHQKPVIFGGYTDQNSSFGLKWGTGAGHEWVCDGYSDSWYEGNESLMFHMNWGWNPTGFNGWYGVNNWAIYDAYGNFVKHYQYCKEVVLDIHP